MTTKFNPGDDILIIGKVEEIAIGRSILAGETTIRYNVQIQSNDDSYMVWLDENTIVGNAF